MHCLSMHRLSLLLLASLLTLAACDSMRDETIDLMTSAPWMTVDAPPESGLAGRYDFQGDGDLRITLADGSVRNTMWTVSEDATALRVIEPGGERRLPIVKLTEDELVLDFGDDGQISFVHV